jgi:hypothetical protein
MAKAISMKSAKVGRRGDKAAGKRAGRDERPPTGDTRELGDCTAGCKIRFGATLLRPETGAGSWAVVALPKKASAKLPSRGMVSVRGTFNGRAFGATLSPDGRGGHWLKVDRKMATGMEAGGVVRMEMEPLAAGDEPEPKVPADLLKALAAASKGAREAWLDITPVARRDWIQWITSGKRAETRAIRIGKACDMLAKGKRRPCCFDRSGMYGKGGGCPAPPFAQGRSKGPAR